MYKKHFEYHRGGMLMIIVIIVALAILAGVAVPKFMNRSEDEGADTSGTSRGLDVKDSNSDSVARESAAPAVSERAACEAGCRDQYGGSGSAGFDACMRTCGAGGVLREGAACAGDGPACSTSKSPVCRDGKWYCRENAISTDTKVP